MLTAVLTFLGDKWKDVLLVLCVGLIAFYGGCRAERLRDDLFGQAAQPSSFGWLDEPDRVKELVASLPTPFFGDVGKELVQGDVDQDALLYKLFEKGAGRPWAVHDQDGTGCCVGEGFSGAVEMLTAVGIATGQKHEYHPISASAVYALSREVGGMLGRGDGSFGAAAAKSLLQFGCLSCDEAKDDNTTGEQHAALAKKWGRTGLPADLKALAAKHKVKTASLVRTPEEVRAALANGYPVAICSSVGFEPFRRDANGFCRMGGSWPHCMFIGAYRADKKAFLVFQSWGKNSPPGPKSLDQPDGTFWIDWAACQRIVRGGDSYALSDFDGYPARKLDVFIRNPVDLKRDYAMARRSLEYALAP